MFQPRTAGAQGEEPTNEYGHRLVERRGFDKSRLIAVAYWALGENEFSFR
jgi:NADPH-dependent ferric siderophore reductase